MFEERVVKYIRSQDIGSVEVVWLIKIEGEDHHEYSGFYTPESRSQFVEDVGDVASAPFMNALEQ